MVYYLLIDPAGMPSGYSYRYSLKCPWLSCAGTVDRPPGIAEDPIAQGD